MSSTSQKPDLKTTGVCRFYATTGSCRFGTKCKFRHDRSNDPKGVSHSTTRSSYIGGSTTTLSAQEPPLSGTTRSPSIPQKPCFAWNRNGRCSKGDACKYKHDPNVKPAGITALLRDSVAISHLDNLKLKRSEAAKEEAAVVQQDVVHEFIIMTYASGLAIQSILTGFESCRIRVEGLPVGTSDSEVQGIFVQQGLDSSQVFISGSTKVGGQFQYMDVICHQEARTIIPVLRSLYFRGHHVSFSLLGGDDHTNSMKSAQNVLTLTWATPSLSCIVDLMSTDRAQATAREFNGKTCNGRKVTVELFPLSASTTTQSVIVHGLHPDTADFMIMSFLGTGLWDVIERQPVRRDDSPYSVRTSLLRQFPPLSRIDDATTDLWSGQHSLKLHFPSWKEAKAAYDFFQQPREFSDYPHFTLHLPDRWTYTTRIPFPQYNAQRRQWEAIQNSATFDAFLIVSPLKPHCILTVDGKDPKAAGALKVQVERLLAGEKLDVWHPFFISPASRHILVQVGRTSNTFIKVDKTARLLKGFGTSERIQQATGLLRAAVTKLEEQERVVHLKRESVRYFVHQGLARMREELGDENVHLNVSSRPVTITTRGGEAARVLLDRLIKESLDGLSPLEPLNSSKMCPVCQDSAGHAVRLDCQHVYCETCFKHYLSTAADNQKFPLVCLGNENTCGYPIPLPTIRKFLVPQIFKTLLEAALDAYIATRPQEFKFCPTPDCRQVYRTNTSVQGHVEICPSCFAEICASCHKEGHDGLTCEEKRLVSDTTALERATEELALQEGYKKCPSCQVWVEKTEGCNHMTCAQCNAHFCWACLECFDSADIYDHMEEAHGGMYEEQVDGVEVIRMPEDPVELGLVDDDPYEYIPILPQAAPIPRIEPLFAAPPPPHIVAQPENPIMPAETPQNIAPQWHSLELVAQRTPTYVAPPDFFLPPTIPLQLEQPTITAQSPRIPFTLLEPVAPREPTYVAPLPLPQQPTVAHHLAQPTTTVETPRNPFLQQYPQPEPAVPRRPTCTAPPPLPPRPTVARYPEQPTVPVEAPEERCWSRQPEPIAGGIRVNRPLPPLPPRPPVACQRERRSSRCIIS